MIFSARLKGGQKNWRIRLRIKLRRDKERGIRREHLQVPRAWAAEPFTASSGRQPPKKSHALAEFFRMSVPGIKKKEQIARLACNFALCFMPWFLSVCFKTKMAESEGFEPSIPTRSITIFETVAFDRSASSPLIFHNIYRFMEFCQFFLSINI